MIQELAKAAKNNILGAHSSMESLTKKKTEHKTL